MAGNRVLSIRSRVEGGGDPALLDEVRQGIAQIQDEMKVSEQFSAELQSAAEEAAAHPRLPGLDRTDIEFVTLDPASAMDLDQAVHIERSTTAFTVHYAIADVAAFVASGDPIDREAHRRGQTWYGAESKIPLHPPAISESAGSLLPGQVRPALLWTLELDASGACQEFAVERALIRSRAKLDYDSVQQQLDQRSADLHPTMALLAEIGPLRDALELERGGVSLPLPEQEVVIEGDHASLRFRSLHPIEQWNAQISLLTGMSAAQLMVSHKVGILRTLPPPAEHDVARLRRTAKALGVPWPRDQHYPEFVRTLDPTQPNHAAMAVACTRLLRGSGYVAFDGELPEHYLHSAIAAPYAHCTAPLRRLVDRFASEVCVALSAGEPVPTWARDGLAALPDIMRETGRLASRYENAIVDLVEALVLQDRIGQEFAGVVVDVDPKDHRKGTVTVADPAIDAALRGAHPLPLGEEVTVRLATADVKARRIEFEIVEQAR